MLSSISKCLMHVGPNACWPQFPKLWPIFKTKLIGDFAKSLQRARYATTPPHSIPPPKYQIRNARETDIPRMVALRKQVFQVESAVRTSLVTDPDAFKIVEAENGEIIGMISCIQVHPDLFISGMLYVKDEYQKSGIAAEVFSASVERVGDKNVSVTVVPFLLRSATVRAIFPLVETRYSVLQISSTGPVDPGALSGDLPEGVAVQPFRGDLFPALCKFDRGLVGFDRGFALELSFAEAGSETLVAVKDGACVGYGSIKPTCLGGRRVGPLYAEEPSVAEGLMKRLLESMPDVNGLAILALSNNVTAHDILLKLDCRPQRLVCPRLYSKKTLDVDTSKIIALSDVTFAPF